MPKYVVQRLNPWSAEYTDVGARAKHLADTPFPAHLYGEREEPDITFHQAQELAGRTGAESPYQYTQSLKHGADLAKRAAGPIDMHAYMMPYLAHVGEEIARSMRRTHEPMAQEMNKKFNTAHPKSLHKDLPARLNRDLEKEIEIQKQLAGAQGWESSIQLAKQDEMRKLLGAELLGKQGVHAQEGHVYNIGTLNKAAQLARSEEIGVREHSLSNGMKILGYPFDLLNRYNRIVRGLPLEYSISAMKEARMPQTVDERRVQIAEELEAARLAARNPRARAAPGQVLPDEADLVRRARQAREDARREGEYAHRREGMAQGMAQRRAYEAEVARDAAPANLRTLAQDAIAEDVRRQARARGESPEAADRLAGEAVNREFYQSPEEIANAHYQAAASEEAARRMVAAEHARLGAEQAALRPQQQPTRLGRLMESLAASAPTALEVRQYGTGPEAVAAWEAIRDRDYAQMLERERAERLAEEQRISALPGVQEARAFNAHQEAAAAAHAAARDSASPDAREALLEARIADLRQQGMFGILNRLLDEEQANMPHIVRRERDASKNVEERINYFPGGKKAFYAFPEAERMAHVDRFRQEHRAAWDAAQPAAAAPPPKAAAAPRPAPKRGAFHPFVQRGHEEAAAAPRRGTRAAQAAPAEMDLNALARMMARRPRR